MSNNDFERHKYNYTIPQDNLRQLKDCRLRNAELLLEVGQLRDLVDMLQQRASVEDDDD